MIFISICFCNQTWFEPLLHSQRLQAVKSYCKVLQISQYSLEKICARVSFVIKVAGLRSATLLKKRLWHRYFPGFYKISKNTFFSGHILGTASGYSIKFYYYLHFFK